MREVQNLGENYIVSLKLNFKRCFNTYICLLEIFIKHHFIISSKPNTIIKSFSWRQNLGKITRSRRVSKPLSRSYWRPISAHLFLSKWNLFKKRLSEHTWAAILNLNRVWVLIFRLINFLGSVINALHSRPLLDSVLGFSTHPPIRAPTESKLDSLHI